MKRGELVALPKEVAHLYPDTPGIKCVSVWIPDDDAYVSILAGLMGLLTKSWYWMGTSEERFRRAEMFDAAYAANDWTGCMDCLGVADCIEDSDEVKAALLQNLLFNIANSTEVQQALNNNYNPHGINPLPETIAEQNLLPAIVDCDFDTLWGSIVQLVDSMNTNNLNAFEIAEAASNLAERASLVLGGIPILETLPVDEAVTYVNTIWTDDLMEAYVANDTTEYTDTLKCALFCLATGRGCRLSIRDVYDYFIDRIAGDAADTFAELIAYLITGTWTGTEINDMFYAGQLLMMYHGNKYFPVVGIRPFQQYLDIGSLSPSAAWSVICDPCAVVPNVYLESNIAIDFEFTFVENIGEDTAVWTGVTKDNLGIYALSCNPTWYGDNVCVEVIEATPVTAYQHFLCGSGTVVSGSGDGASDTVFYEELGWYTAAPETMITITVRRID